MGEQDRGPRRSPGLLDPRRHATRLLAVFVDARPSKLFQKRGLGRFHQRPGTIRGAEHHRVVAIEPPVVEDRRDQEPHVVFLARRDVDQPSREDSLLRRQAESAGTPFQMAIDPHPDPRDLLDRAPPSGDRETGRHHRDPEPLHRFVHRYPLASHHLWNQGRIDPPRTGAVECQVRTPPAHRSGGRRLSSRLEVPDPELDRDFDRILHLPPLIACGSDRGIHRSTGDVVLIDRGEGDRKEGECGRVSVEPPPTENLTTQPKSVCRQNPVPGEDSTRTSDPVEVETAPGTKFEILTH